MFLLQKSLLKERSKSTTLKGLSATLKSMSQPVNDNGGGRLGIERRQYRYLVHIPERRSGKQRRSGIDRRKGRGAKLEKNKERRVIFKIEFV